MQTLLILILMSVGSFGSLAAIIPEDPVHKYFRKTIEEKKRMKKKKEAEELERRLREEDKYDNDYRKRHS